MTRREKKLNACYLSSSIFVYPTSLRIPTHSLYLTGDQAKEGDKENRKGDESEGEDETAIILFHLQG